MARRVRISLANKCQLLFGVAVVVILTAALAVCWLRMRTLVSEGQEEAARKLAEAWLAGRIEVGGPLALSPQDPPPADDVTDELRMTLIGDGEFEQVAAADPFVARAIDRLGRRPLVPGISEEVDDGLGPPRLRYAHAVRRSDLLRLRRAASMDPESVREPGAIDTPDALRMVLLVETTGQLAPRQLTLNRIYVIAAGLFAGLLAIGVFWFITTRLILSPVRLLRSYAQKVSEGNLNIRSDINTGDEFEQLSDMFNTMLDRLNDTYDDLSSAKKSLDLKLGELAQSNVALYEANKIKGEFLANVSHELRTPLNSIIGFAEVLDESMAATAAAGDEKRRRYCGNIITSSRRLLDLINDLLDLAKIEAGRMELHVTAVSMADTVEGLVNLMRPQAEKRRVELVTKVRPNIPKVMTDAGRLQQVLFNFLSNAIKFTPDGGLVTVTAEADEDEPDGDGSAPAADVPRRVRISVRDTGPGIPAKDLERIFDKFTQLDPGVTKEHGGTGLGLTISRELAALLQGRITVESESGQGATFSLVIPVEMQKKSAALMPATAGEGA